MAVSFIPKDKYTMEDLLEIMHLLRSPDGCPWDREQTHESIRSNLLEETHEAIEAINNGDMELLKEELGDVLLQIVFHSCMAEETSSFDYGDVVDGICKKLVVRHPHVFGDVSADNTEQVLQNWDAIKRRSKGGKTQSELLGSLPRSLPSLMRAGKVQNRAKRVGFDWPDISGALEALDSEREELAQAIASGDAQQIEQELGDLLFSAVNVSRFVDCDAEQALTVATDKFIKRFSIVEKLAGEQGLSMTSASLDELDALWKQAKKDLSATD